MKRTPQILYEDNHLLVLNKPGGMLVQGDRTGDPTLLAWAKHYLKEKYQKPGNVYLALVHRLDRVTSGVVVLARTSKAAARLSQAFREKQVQKIYLAVVHGSPKKPHQTLMHYLLWDPKSRRTRVFQDPRPEAQKAILRYELIESIGTGQGIWARNSGNQKPSLWFTRIKENGPFSSGRKFCLSLLQIKPFTGRKHQIRAQLAAIGHPIVGDFKYGSKEKVFQGRAILLHAWKITLPHPTRREEITFEAPLPEYWPGKGKPRLSP